MQPTTTDTFSFGLPLLDSFGRPPRRGQLAVISGHPGSGMSMYARTFALANAAAGHRVAFHSTQHRRDQAEQAMAIAAGDTGQSPVDVSGAELDLAEHRGLYAGGEDDVLVIDSLDTEQDSRWEVLQKLKSQAQASSLLIVATLTESWVDPVEQNWSARRLRDWESQADVVIALNRPEALDFNHERVGEVDVRLLRNTNGPCGEETALCQGHRRRLTGIC